MREPSLAPIPCRSHHGPPGDCWDLLYQQARGGFWGLVSTVAYRTVQSVSCRWGLAAPATARTVWGVRPGAKAIVQKEACLLLVLGGEGLLFCISFCFGTRGEGGVFIKGSWLRFSQ